MSRVLVRAARRLAFATGVFLLVAGTLVAGMQLAATLGPSRWPVDDSAMGLAMGLAVWGLLLLLAAMGPDASA